MTKEEFLLQFQQRLEIIRDDTECAEDAIVDCEQYGVRFSKTHGYLSELVYDLFDEITKLALLCNKDIDEDR